MSRNVLITGGSRGIGLAIAKELAKNGYHLAINGVRDEHSVIEVLEDLKQYGSQIIYCQGDISSNEDRIKILKQIKKGLGVLHVLINNAGVAPRERKDILEMSADSYDRVMDINLKGPFFLTQEVANQMLQSKNGKSDFKGCIVNVSSVSAHTASVFRGEYCMSKAGMSMMTKLFAVRLGKEGIPVYEVQPGVIETDMTAAVLEKYQKMVHEGFTLIPRLGQPGDVARAVKTLVDGNIPYATGETIKIDGGMSIRTL